MKKTCLMIANIRFSVMKNDISPVQMINWLDALPQFYGQYLQWHIIIPYHGVSVHNPKAMLKMDSVL